MSLTGNLETNAIGGGYGGFGGGWGGIAPIGLFGVANGLFGRDGRREDCGGGNVANDNNINQTIFGTSVLNKLGNIEAAIPLGALSTQNALLEQTIALNSTANQNNLSQLQATAGVKDTVQNSATVLLGAINAIGSKIDQNRISELETQLAQERNSFRSREVEVNVNQTVSQAQAQAQTQAQIQGLFGVLSNLANDLQAVKQGQVIFNSGTMAASGTQAAANTKVA